MLELSSHVFYAVNRLDRLSELVQDHIMGRSAADEGLDEEEATDSDDDSEAGDTFDESAAMVPKRPSSILVNRRATVKREPSNRGQHSYEHSGASGTISTSTSNSTLSNSGTISTSISDHSSTVI